MIRQLLERKDKEEDKESIEEDTAEEKGDRISPKRNCLWHSLQFTGNSNSKRVRDISNMRYAPSAFFKVFSSRLLKGNPETALVEPYTLVLTEKMERKYFGGESALGMTLILDDSKPFTVTGVVQIPDHSHLQFDILLSFSTLSFLFLEQ